MKRFFILFSLLFSTPLILLQSLPVLGQLNTTFVPITPCRIIDTREPAAGGQLIRLERRDFNVAGPTTDYSDQGGTPAGCGIPSRTRAVAINLVAVNPANSGNIQAWPSSQDRPTNPPASVINFSSLNPFPTIANGIILGLGTTPQGDIAVLATQNVDLVADVYGYFPEFSNVINVNELRSSNTDVNIRANEDVGVMIDFLNNSFTDAWTVYENGAFVNSNRLARIQEGSGNLAIRGELQAGGLDLAELYRIDPSETNPIMPGHVVMFSGPDTVMLSDVTPGDVTPGNLANCRKVVGPVSTDPGVVLGEGEAILNPNFHSPELQEKFKQLTSALMQGLKSAQDNEDFVKQQADALEIVVEENFVPVALEGRVLVKVESELPNSIVAGDLLYPGNNGVAVKTPPATDTDCPSIGVAMENLTGTSGSIMVLIR